MITILLILNTLLLIFLCLIEVDKRLREMRVSKAITGIRVYEPPPPTQEKVEFPPPEESGVIAGSEVEYDLMESGVEESSDEREYIEELKRERQRGQS